MSVTRGIPFLLFVSLLVIGCQDNSTQGVTVITGTSVEASVQSWVSTVWCGNNGNMYSLAGDLYIYEHCDEIQDTLEIVDLNEGKDASGNTVTAAFLRYSVGTKVFRTVFWYRKMGDRYVRTVADAPRTYSDEEDWNAKALKIAEEADSWEEDSATWYE